MAASAFEKKRLEELFHYFQAASHAIGLANNDIDSERHYDPALARVSLDPVLNALCQLGVHRLNCDRAFISLIDHENQYIISEMTKSVSLYDTSLHDVEDAICMGARPLDLFSGVCAGTLPAFKDGPVPNPHHVNTPNMFANETYYVINDFSLEPAYKDRPYVKGPPHMRYYVEVPIRTSHGYVIGSYAVIDDKPRHGINEKDLRALVEISSSIMRHIEMVKLRDDYAQSSRLLKGLDSLVQDGRRRDVLQGSDVSNGLMPTDGGSSAVGQSLSHNGIALEAKEVNPTSTKRNQHHDLETSLQTPTDVNPPGSIATTLPPASVLTLNSVTPIASRVDEPKLGPDEQRKLDHAKARVGRRDFNISADVRSSFGIAAESLRAAMDLDGVLFVDCSPGKISPPHQGLLDPDTKVSTTQQSSARLLGASTKVSENENESGNLLRKCNISQSLHENLVLRYPQGHVFHFELGQLPEDAPLPVSTSYFPRADLRRVREALSSREISDEIHLSMPCAKAVVFFPLWNAAKRDWFAGCLGWSSHEKRIFRNDDLAYFNIFGNSLIARAASLDLIATDQAKSDFISNISHELRSPLHGILGNTELLRELTHDADQQQMLAMVEQCGRTLLDTMNHVLEYSKISSIAQNGKNRKAAELLGSEAESNNLNLKNLSTFDLTLLVEEVVESMVAGHQHNSRAQAVGNFTNMTEATRSRNEDIEHLKDLPIVILKIDYQANWVVESDAPSWRRCILNLLGNALKYTNSGHIEVHVSSNAGQGKLKDIATILFRDTGRGIGKTHLENHLFRPFVQEDALSSGVGLGLSIVKSLIDAMGGWLEIRSQVGEGTQVELSIPVRFVSAPAEDNQMAVLQHPGRTVSFPGFETTASDKNNAGDLATQKRLLALRRAVSAHLGDWLKIDVNSSTSADPSEADIVVFEEGDVRLKDGEDLSRPSTFQLSTKSILLVLCTQHKMHHHSMYSKTDRVFYLSQPFGPRRLASLISRLTASSNDSETPQHTVRRRSRRQSLGFSPSDATTWLLSRAQETDPTASTLNSSDANTLKPSTAAKIPHILLVDDNDINLALLIRCMRQQNVTYLTASNGAEAVEAYKIANPPFDFVFMDISMPVMDGFAATRAIRDFERSSSRVATRIVAMTGLDGADAREEGAESGVDVYLVKPVGLKKVRGLIQELSRP